MESQKVWAPDDDDGFVIGTIVDIAADVVTIKVRDEKIVKVPYNGVYPVGEATFKDVDDNCALMFLNEATLLNNIKIRYAKDKIYTYVANILIAINPYFEIKNLYSSATLQRYQGKSLGVLPPHVYAIGDKAFRDMKALKQSQSVIVSGESGAGKTESTKYILRYLCESWGTQSGQIEQLILDANPILEAFGNAKTVRNNNSSRFGKFIEIHFNGTFNVVGGFISHYLLEKSRICTQSPGERNYHIFYQLCAGLPNTLWRVLKLSNPDDFNYLKNGCTQYFGSNQHLDKERQSKAQQKNNFLRDPIVDDIKDFQSTDHALRHFGVQEAERLEIYKIVAAVLHLGNINFEESLDDTRGGCRVRSGTAEFALQTAAELIGLNGEELKQCLLSRLMHSKGGSKGTVYLVPLKVYEAQNARDALAKALYSKLFDHIVTRIINKSIPLNGNKYYVGVLDIAGFEYFQLNSFEQFCINYCNEKLQQFFNERILKEEQAIYEKEGLGLKHIQFVDNQDCIDLLETKATGIFDLLDEESKLPKPSSAHFTEAVHSSHKNHFRLDVPRKSKLRDHRDLRDDEGFLIRHFAGGVCYQTALFIEKNNDALHGSLESLMTDGNPLVRELFTHENGVNQSSKPSSGKLNFISVGGKFRSQLNDLMRKLKSTGTHFVRCIKPNIKMIPHEFDGSQVLSQLRCSGMTTVLELMQQGYPSRASFSDLYSNYKKCLPPELARLEPRMFCKLLFKALGLNENDFRFGSTKVFFRPGKFAEFDQIMKSDPEHLSSLVAKVKKWLIVSRWKQAQWCALSVIKLKNKILFRRAKIVVIQRNIKMHLVKKKYRFRYMGILKVKKLRSVLKEIISMSERLKSNEDKVGILNKIKTIEEQLADLSTSLKHNTTLTPKMVDSKLIQVDAAINDQVARLRGKIKQEESLQKVQKTIEEEKRQREAEERKRQEEEELRKRKMEIEERCKKEAAKSSALDTSTQSVLQLQRAIEMEQEQEHQRILQEKLDYELALKLARESGSEAQRSSPTSFNRSASSNVQHQNSSEKHQNKYDLSKWRYSDLRDIINTSCDIDLLEACKEEFHRRLKVYHAWKLKNAKSKEDSKELRAPDSIMNNVTRLVNPAAAAAKSTEQRYFRIPFVRASSTTGLKGWWWAHFNGQWIARQMEIHPEKPPILLVAGRDDMSMCELSLDETRLTTKRGAEILEEEFEREWKKNGGEPIRSS